MAEQQEKPDNDELEGITDEDAKRLLEKPDEDVDKDDDDDEGTDQLGDAGKRAIDRQKERARSAREERDRVKAELAEAQKALSQYSDRDKSETQKLTEERDKLRDELTKATSSMQRREVAEDLAPDHATAAQIRQVAKRLRGDTEAELKADAEELYALIAPEPPKRHIGGRPQERGGSEGNPRGGGDPDRDDPGEMDPRKLAARIPRAR